MLKLPGGSTHSPRGEALGGQWGDADEFRERVEGSDVCSGPSPPTGLSQSRGEVAKRPQAGGGKGEKLEENTTTEWLCGGALSA